MFKQLFLNCFKYFHTQSDWQKHFSGYGRIFTIWVLTTIFRQLMLTELELRFVRHWPLDLYQIVLKNFYCTNVNLCVICELGKSQELLDASGTATSKSFLL